MGLLDSIIGAESGGNPNARHLSAQDNAKIAFDYYVSQGLSPVQAAGIVGNLQGESGQGLNPNAVNRGDGSDGSNSIGIGQWNSSRAQALKDFAASRGMPWNDLNTQLEFLHQELKGPESAAYRGLLAARTPEEAGQAMLAFERPKDWNKPGAHPERGQYAAKVYASYGGGQPQPAPASPAAPANGLLNASAAPAAPGLAPAAPAAPAGLGGPPAQGGFQVSDIQAPPIFYAPRKMPDLSKLRAAFKAPILRG